MAHKLALPSGINCALGWQLTGTATRKHSARDRVHAMGAGLGMHRTIQRLARDIRFVQAANAVHQADDAQMLSTSRKLCWLQTPTSQFEECHGACLASFRVLDETDTPRAELRTADGAIMSPVLMPYGTPNLRNPWSGVEV